MDIALPYMSVIVFNVNIMYFTGLLTILLSCYTVYNEEDWSDEAYLSLHV